MTSTSPTLPLARRLGTLLGLSEGLDGPTTLKISLGDNVKFADVVSVPSSSLIRPSSIPSGHRRELITIPR